MTSADPAALKEIITRLKAEEKVSESDAKEIETVCEGNDSITLPQPCVDESPEVIAKPIEEVPEEKTKDIRTAIKSMTLPQKMKLAMFGNGIARGLLIMDANRMIQEFVLKNPKLTMPEIEVYSKNPYLSQHVLRIISNNSEWMREYAVKLNIVSNPKVPSDLALRWMRFLNVGDLRKLAKSKNVPSLISTTAKKRLGDMEKK